MTETIYMKENSNQFLFELRPIFWLQYVKNVQIDKQKRFII